MFKFLFLSMESRSAGTWGFKHDKSYMAKKAIESGTQGRKNRKQGLKNANRLDRQQ